MFAILKAVNPSLSKNLTNAFRIILGICFLTACSKIKFEIGMIPITLQSVAALLIGFIYKPRIALYTVFLWLSIGFAIRFPVFAGNAPSSILALSSGYLIGFGVCAFIVALLKEKYPAKKFLVDLIIVFLGQGIIYALGIAWLTVLLGFSVAIKVGLLPFVLPGVVKCVIFVTIMNYIKKA